MTGADTDITPQTVLRQLVDGSRQRAEPLRPHLDRLMDHCATMASVRSLGAALRHPGMSVIAEIKRRSPSVGAIAPDVDAIALARAYQAGGAAAVSVLTEPIGFGAWPADLPAVARHADLPTLRKDFVVDAAQVWETRAMGADAVLLIVAILGDGALASLLAAARSAGLEALVEAHSEAEVAAAVDAGADIVGVNNRDLGTFAVDLATAERLRAAIPDGVVTVAESGVSSPAAATRMADAGYDAILVGEAASRAADPADFIASLRIGR
ncbi:MAG TPA: indole-3-glycerol phosphate synthase TrpC [Acidimicrobiia bacterium]|nr:indole-3-glycerol phosphate synthase TrpC [Acidimicrobiia bacterium]